MRFTMSTDEKKSIDISSLVIDQPESSIPTNGRSKKKIIIIAATSTVVAAMVLIAILVGVYINAEAQKEIVQFTMQLKNDMKQDVYSNPNTNTVQLHVFENEQETWIVNDYNADVSVLKIKSKQGTNCYVTPLNETASPMDVLKMKTDGVNDNAETLSLVFSTNGSPIKDTSFLSKTARDTCSGISTYWLYPSCDSPIKSDAPAADRQKRSIYYAYCGGYRFYSRCPFRYSCSHSGSKFYFRYIWVYSNCTGPMYRSITHTTGKTAIPTTLY